jgi:hypothetical protein
VPDINWSNETAVRDAFVEAVHAQDSLRANAAGHVLINESFGGSFSYGELVESGTLLTEYNLPQHPRDVEDTELPLLTGLVSEQRLRQLQVAMLTQRSCDDDPFTRRELDLWKKAAAEDILEATDLDWDVYSMWAVRCVSHSDGRKAYITDIGGGYSFSEPRSEYQGFGVTLDDALESLKPAGFLDVDDFRARGPGSA